MAVASGGGGRWLYPVGEGAVAIASRGGGGGYIQ